MIEQSTIVPESERYEFEAVAVDSNSTNRVQEVGLDALHKVASNIKYSQVIGCLVLVSGVGHIAQGNKIRGTLQTGLAFAMFNQ